MVVPGENLLPLILTPIRLRRFVCGRCTQMYLIPDGEVTTTTVRLRRLIPESLCAEKYLVFTTHLGSTQYHLSKVFGTHSLHLV